ncbi:glycosyltransferase family A protein [Sphingobacterium sp. UT-1RO-CII-1]|uniref:glycosyltransferase family 2 protein n=1 Tax=Sphingobacterium sp. UT-1RO-CII-1 TaxID=2995225 RepID=UPI00227D18D3|nr:glycosyltransferase family A protein [Sphingobacterium sp. UT-1RO-CII-1]MCY4780804.1 glycosyltransferase family A protein [Sphingobacterium sp. UT-1RO-CII-1]
MEKNLLSIITPCYNGETYIYRLLESILKQTYPFVEIIIINDGSTDNTEEIILSYEDRFKLKGYQFKYVFQLNGGQAKALNTGLRLYTGEYLTWPDSDDFYISENALEVMVKTLQQSENNVGSVRAFANMYSEKSLSIIGKLGNPKTPYNPNLFMDCVFENNFWFAPVCYMVKSEYVKEYVGEAIEVNRIGQNFQMFIPLFCSKDTITIRKLLMGYLVRDNSHSRDLGDFFNQVKRLKDIANLKIRLLEKNCCKNNNMQIIRGINNLSLKKEVLLMADFKMFFKSVSLLISNFRLLFDSNFVKSYFYFLMRWKKLK